MSRRNNMAATMTDMPSLHFKGDELLTALEERRSWAEKLDNKRLTTHQRAEREYVKAFQAACRAAAKWDYTKIKENYGELRLRREMSMPSCPMSVTAKLEKAISTVKLGRRASCVVSPEGQWSTVYWLLTYDENAPNAELC